LTMESNDLITIISRTIFDFEAIKKLLTSPKFTFWYPPMTPTTLPFSY